MNGLYSARLIPREGEDLADRGGGVRPDARCLSWSGIGMSLRLVFRAALSLGPRRSSTRPYPGDALAPRPIRHSMAQTAIVMVLGTAAAPT
jgi:hypothetical protein